MVLVEEAEFGSKAYEEMLCLRKRILRDPLGLEWTEEEESWEPRERHFGVRGDSGIIACVVIRPLGSRAVKLRQMAVESAWQGTGIGSGLLEGVEVILLLLIQVLVEKLLLLLMELVLHRYNQQ